jgi:hypothetical protein
VAAEGQVCRGMAAPGEYAGGVIGHQELAALLAPFGMIV